MLAAEIRGMAAAKVLMALFAVVDIASTRQSAAGSLPARDQALSRPRAHPCPSCSKLETLPEPPGAAATSGDLSQQPGVLMHENIASMEPEPTQRVGLAYAGN